MRQRGRVLKCAGHSPPDAYEMFRSAKYQQFHPLAEEALKRRVLWPSEPVMPYRTQTVDFQGGEWLALLMHAGTGGESV